VTPTITVSFWSHDSSEEDDNSGWSVHDVKWDTVGGITPHLEDERIRIRCQISVKGEHAQVVALGYHVLGQGILADRPSPRERMWRGGQWVGGIEGAGQPQ
jgi:hypothetical protein